MKKFLLMLGAVALFTACGDDSGSGSGASINYEEGYKYLTNLNVSDAKMIYQKSSATRATGDDSYYKLDLSGNEVKLSIKGEDGQDHNIGIHKVLKLSDKVLLVNPIAQDIIDLFYKPGPDDLGISVAWGSTEYLSIVDVQTEKIYRWPKEIDVYLGEGIELQSVLDNQGNIYIATSNNQICKLDISNFTIQEMLPNGQNFSDFNVTSNGFVMYGNSSAGWNSYYVKCPGGRIKPINGVAFVVNGDLYSCDKKEISRWKPIGDNDLEQNKVCDFNNEPDNPSYTIQEIMNNYVRKTVILEDDFRNWYEFDGENCLKIELSEEWKEKYHSTLCTSKAWYRGWYHKLSMEDYKESQLQIVDYQIQEFLTSPESPNITFTGFRYLDGANVLGIINEADEIIIDNVSENKIINLVPLN